MTIDRKAAVAAYKERKARAGIYAVRCAATGEIWVGRTPNLDTVRNRHWFGLGLGTHPNRPLQAAWTAHGADAFSFEIVEVLEEEEIASVRESQLKGRAAHWRQAMAAATL